MEISSYKIHKSTVDSTERMWSLWALAKQSHAYAEYGRAVDPANQSRILCSKCNTILMHRLCQWPFAWHSPNNQIGLRCEAVTVVATLAAVADADVEEGVVHQSESIFAFASYSYSNPSQLIVDCN